MRSDHVVGKNKRPARRWQSFGFAMGSVALRAFAQPKPGEVDVFGMSRRCNP